MREELQPYFVPQQDMSFAEQVLSHWRRSVFHTLRKVHLARETERHRGKDSERRERRSIVTNSLQRDNTQGATCTHKLPVESCRVLCFENIDIPQLFCLGLAQCQRLPGAKFSLKKRKILRGQH